MTGGRADNSKWQKQRGVVKALQAQLARQCSLHVEAELERCLSIEREKVLCDMLVHAEFLQQLVDTFVEQQDGPETQHAGSEEVAAEVPGQSARDNSTGRSPVPKEEGSPPEQQQMQPPPPQQQMQPPRPPPQQGKELEQEQVVVPQSYVASLLRQATPEQVQHVLRMTAQDWADFYAAQFSELLMHLELWSRAELAASSSTGCNSSSGAATAATSSHHGSSAGRGQSSDQAPEQQQPQQQPTRGWPWQQVAPTFSPAHDRAALLDLISQRVQHQLLGCVINLPPLIQAEALLTDGGRLGCAGEAFYEGVTDRLQLSPLQELHLSICMAELQRMNATSSAQDLLQRAAEPSLLVAAAQHQQEQQPAPHTQQQQQQQQQQQHDDSGFSRVSSMEASFAAAAAATASAFPEAARQQRGGPMPGAALSGEQQDGATLLKQFADKRSINLVCAQVFIVNTLSRYQLAVLCVASYPQIPGTFAIANTAARRVRRRQQQWLQQVVAAAKAAGRDPDAHGSVSALEQTCGVPWFLAPGSAAAGACRKGAQGAAEGAVPYSQQLLREHERERAEQMRLHQRHCWAHLGSDLPTEEPQ